MFGQVHGVILGVIAFVSNSFVHANPLILNTKPDEEQAWVILMKYLAVIGGALLLLSTSGKQKSQDRRSSLKSPFQEFNKHSQLN